MVAEPPCLSLADCGRPAGPSEAGGDEVTLAYPSLVALRQAKLALERDPKGPSAREAAGIIEHAKSSKTSAVARLAGRGEPR